MAKIGAPTIYTPELATAICNRLAQGESLRSVCRDKEMPNIQTVVEWFGRYPDTFGVQYQQARRASADLMAEDILDISDNDENTNRARLRVETRKWIMARMQPKKYGDTVDMTSGGAPMSISIDAIIGLVQQSKPPALPAEEAQPVKIGNLTI